MITSVEFCPVCKTTRTMQVIRTKIPVYESESYDRAKPFGKRWSHGKQTGLVTAWVYCEACNTFVRSLEMPLDKTV